MHIAAGEPRGPRRRRCRQWLRAGCLASQHRPACGREEGPVGVACRFPVGTALIPGTDRQLSPLPCGEPGSQACRAGFRPQRRVRPAQRPPHAPQPGALHRPALIVYDLDPVRARSTQPGGDLQGGPRALAARPEPRGGDDPPGAGIDEPHPAPAERSHVGGVGKHGLDDQCRAGIADYQVRLRGQPVPEDARRDQRRVQPAIGPAPGAPGLGVLYGPGRRRVGHKHVDDRTPGAAAMLSAGSRSRCLSRQPRDLHRPQRRGLHRAGETRGMEPGQPGQSRGRVRRRPQRHVRNGQVRGLPQPGGRRVPKYRAHVADRGSARLRRSAPIGHVNYELRQPAAGSIEDQLDTRDRHQTGPAAGPGGQCAQHDLGGIPVDGHREHTVVCLDITGVEWGPPRALHRLEKSALMARSSAATQSAWLTSAGAAEVRDHSRSVRCSTAQ